MIDLQSTYADLPPGFHQRIEPSAAVDPELLAFNDALAETLGLELSGRSPHELALLFSGARLPASARPIAMAYAGHQFGGLVPSLGDGRAILLGEVVSPPGQRFDIHLKGAGQTAFSRRGDGRSSLGPVIREYIVSEAMHALGIPTTRALAAVATGETVYRERALPGAVLARVASSHIRIGTFEYFAVRGQTDHLQTLADYTIARHYPELTDSADPYLDLFHRVAERQLALVARWMGVGFIHGVMNTDNTSISGETIDFGPCAFVDAFDFDQVYSSIDHQGRYRYRMQGSIVIWNLSVLANCLVPLIGPDKEQAVAKLRDALDGLHERFELELLKVMGNKLGIVDTTPEADGALVEIWLQHLDENRLDFTNSFRALARQVEAHERGDGEVEPVLGESWLKRLAEQPAPLPEAIALMDASNPAVIPRNHQVEKAIASALDGDLSHFHQLNEALASPYGEPDGFEWLTAPPEPHEIVHQTFCGT